MGLSPSIRRKTENESLFRTLNEGVQKGFDQVKQLAHEDGSGFFEEHSNAPLHFYCECADENCHKRIELTLDRYTEIHKNRELFIVLRGHVDETIEEIVDEKPMYRIVKKKYPVPENVETLNRTDLNHK